MAKNGYSQMAIDTLILLYLETTMIDSKHSVEVNCRNTTGGLTIRTTIGYPTILARYVICGLAFLRSVGRTTGCV